MKDFTDENSTSSASSSHSKTSKHSTENSKLNQLLFKLNLFIGYWVISKNVTKKGPDIFIRDLNRCTSYYPKERNHTFTDVFYIPEAGFCIIHFLSKKFAAQYFSQRQGVNWLGQTEDSEDDDDLELIEDDSDSEKENERGYHVESPNYEIYQFEGNHENGENFCYSDDKGEEASGILLPCEIKKVKITEQKKILKLIQKNLKKIKTGQKVYYYILFKDTENAENFFSHVDFNYPL